MEPEWVYKGEGNANIVYAYSGTEPSLQGCVLRVRKRYEHRAQQDEAFLVLEELLWSATMAWSSNPLLREASYKLAHVAPVLGSRFVHVGLPVALPTALKSQLIDKELESTLPAILLPDHTIFSGASSSACQWPDTVAARRACSKAKVEKAAPFPAHLQQQPPAPCLGPVPTCINAPHKGSSTCMDACGALTPPLLGSPLNAACLLHGFPLDATSPLDGSPLDAAFPLDGPPVDAATRMDGFLLNGASLAAIGPAICVEIKPKCGFLPTAPTIVPEYAVKHHLPRYFMHQLLKFSKGKVRRLSAYNPLDMFSGEGDRMAVAIAALLKIPQNNLRIFQDGVMMYGGSDGLSVEDLESRLQQLWLEHGTWGSGWQDGQRERDEAVSGATLPNRHLSRYPLDGGARTSKTLQGGLSASPQSDPAETQRGDFLEVLQGDFQGGFAETLQGDFAKSLQGVDVNSTAPYFPEARQGSGETGMHIGVQQAVPDLILKSPARSFPATRQGLAETGMQRGVLGDIPQLIFKPSPPYCSANQHGLKEQQRSAEPSMHRGLQGARLPTSQNGRVKGPMHSKTHALCVPSLLACLSQGMKYSLLNTFGALTAPCRSLQSASSPAVKANGKPSLPSQSPHISAYPLVNLGDDIEGTDEADCGTGGKAGQEAPAGLNSKVGSTSGQRGLEAGNVWQAGGSLKIRGGEQQGQQQCHDAGKSAITTPGMPSIAFVDAGKSAIAKPAMSTAGVGIGEGPETGYLPAEEGMFTPPRSFTSPQPGPARALLVRIICSTLQHTGVIQRLLALQRLDKWDVEGTAIILKRLLQAERESVAVAAAESASLPCPPSPRQYPASPSPPSLNTPPSLPLPSTPSSSSSNSYPILHAPVSSSIPTLHAAGRPPERGEPALQPGVSTAPASPLKLGSKALLASPATVDKMGCCGAPFVLNISEHGNTNGGMQCGTYGSTTSGAISRGMCCNMSLGNDMPHGTCGNATLVHGTLEGEVPTASCDVDNTSSANCDDTLEAHLTRDQSSNELESMAGVAQISPRGKLLCQEDALFCPLSPPPAIISSEHLSSHSLQPFTYPLSDCVSLDLEAFVPETYEPEVCESKAFEPMTCKPSARKLQPCKQAACAPKARELQVSEREVCKSPACSLKAREPESCATCNVHHLEACTSESYAAHYLQQYESESSASQNWPCAELACKPEALSVSHELNGMPAAAENRRSSQHANVLPSPPRPIHTALESACRSSVLAEAAAEAGEVGISQRVPPNSLMQVGASVAAPAAANGNRAQQTSRTTYSTRLAPTSPMRVLHPSSPCSAPHHLRSPVTAGNCASSEPPVQPSPTGTLQRANQVFSRKPSIANHAMAQRHAAAVDAALRAVPAALNLLETAVQQLQCSRAYGALHAQRHAAALEQLERLSLPECLAALRGYLIAATAKDCGIMLTLQQVARPAQAPPVLPAAPAAAFEPLQVPAVTHAPHVASVPQPPSPYRPGVRPPPLAPSSNPSCPAPPGDPWPDLSAIKDPLRACSSTHLAPEPEELIVDPDTGLMFRCKVAFVDLDLKPLSKVLQHLELDARIVEHTLQVLPHLSDATWGLAGGQNGTPPPRE